MTTKWKPVNSPIWPFPTELPKPMPSTPIPFNPDNHEDALL